MNFRDAPEEISDELQKELHNGDLLHFSTKVIVISIKLNEQFLAKRLGSW